VKHIGVFSLITSLFYGVGEWGWFMVRCVLILLRGQLRATGSESISTINI